MKIKYILLTIIGVILIYIVILLLFRNIFFPRKYKSIVEKASSIYNVDPNLVYSIIKQESKFNKDAISSSGAKGLMQLMDSTANEMAQNINSINIDNYNIYEPETNILLGTKYISYLINYFNGNYYLAIVAYNAGMGKINDWTQKNYSKYIDFNDVYNCIEYIETKNYFNNVIINYDFYTKLY